MNLYWSQLSYLIMNMQRWQTTIKPITTRLSNMWDPFVFNIWFGFSGSSNSIADFEFLNEFMVNTNQSQSVKCLNELWIHLQSTKSDQVCREKTGKIWAPTIDFRLNFGCRNVSESLLEQFVHSIFFISGFIAEICELFHMKSAFEQKRILMNKLFDLSSLLLVTNSD